MPGPGEDGDSPPAYRPNARVETLAAAVKSEVLSVSVTVRPAEGLTDQLGQPAVVPSFGQLMFVM